MGRIHCTPEAHADRNLPILNQAIPTSKVPFDVQPHPAASTPG